MKILLTGASGFIGSQISQALQTGGHQVVPVSRASGFDFNQLRTPTAWLPHMGGVDVVINAVGIIVETPSQRFATLHYHAPMALFQACVQAGVKRVIQISALGADEQAITPYHLTKKSADDVLRALPLEWFVLRPSLVYGMGGKSTQWFTRLVSLPVIPLVGKGLQAIQPVHVADVVDAVMACLSTQPAQCTIDVVGPQAMTFTEWLQRLRHAMGKSPAPTLVIPNALVNLTAHLLHPMLPLLHPDNLRMLAQGNTADVQPLAQLLGRMPRAVP